MKKIYSFIVMFFVFSIVFSQGYEVTYQQKISLGGITTESEFQLLLDVTSSKSVYFELNKSVFHENEDEFIATDNNVVPFVEKDYSKKEIVYNQPIINRIVVVKDDLPLQKWKILDEVKIIKSLKCKKATTTFRGRSYSVWFTESIPTIGGPWKFDGLPGLILEVTSNDGVFKIETTKIEKKKKTKKIELKYDATSLISWNEYCEKYKKVIIRIRKSLKAENEQDTDYEFNIDLVEDIGL